MAYESTSIQYYLKKTFLKTASLICNGCKSIALLTNENSPDPEISNMAADYGANLGLAFQIIDDYLDFVGSEKNLGKVTSVDLKLGLATAPGMM
jgi:geranylgeranyl pyrophosphate synthase